MIPDLRIVLVEPSHPGNIGAAARAMKTMDLESLYLVSPRQYPCAEATARASGADDLLARAQVCATLDEALTGCRLIIGASARLRSLKWPTVDPQAAAQALVREASDAPVAMLFGREDSGLTNAELGRCHQLMHIPANPDYSSLNLAAAVQLVAWEIRKAGMESLSVADDGDHVPVGADEMARFYQHLEETLVALDFLDPDNPRQLMHRLRRLYNRARPDQVEMNILRGILTAAQKAVREPT